MEERDEIRALSVDELLQSLTDAGPPAGGSAAAVAVAMAAALVAMTARVSSGRWEGADRDAEAAEGLLARATPLAHEDVAAYDEVMVAMRLVGDDREERVAVALARAADPPLAVAGAGGEVAELAARVAERSSAILRPDAVAAALLAEAGAGAAARLVAANLARADADPRHAEAREHAERARAAAERARRLDG